MKKFGLIGFPLGHSFSKNFFNEKFHSENIDAEYVNFEIPTIEDFPKVLAANPNLAGLNVTRRRSFLTWTNWTRMLKPSERLT